MKHEQIFEQLLMITKNNPNALGFIVFGSVASGTQHEKSDIDTITILRNQKPSSGMENTIIDGIKIGNIFFTYEILLNRISIVPYLLDSLVNAKILFDREHTIKLILEKIKEYFKKYPIEDKYNRYYRQLKEEKIKFGYEKTTIIDVWN